MPEGDGADAEGPLQVGGALTEDIERWLADEPVSAWPEPFWVRWRRWLVRHRSLVAGAMAVIGVAFLALVANAFLQQRANRNLRMANQRVEHARDNAEARFDLALHAAGLFQQAVEESQEVRKLAPLRGKLLRAPLNFYRNLRDDIQASGDTRPKTIAALAEANFRLALLTGKIDSQANAIRSYDEATTLLGRLAAEHPDVVMFRTYLAQSYINLGELRRAAGLLDEARTSFERAGDVLKAIARDDPASINHFILLGSTYINLGTVDRIAGKLDEARARFEQARDVLKGLANDHPEAPECRSELARVHEHFGLFHYASGRKAEAMASYEQAWSIREGLLRDDPANTEYRVGLAGVSYDLGNLCLAYPPFDPRANFERRATSWRSWSTTTQPFLNTGRNW